METRSNRRPSISFVGAGALAAGLGTALKAHGFTVDELAVRTPNAFARRLAKSLDAKLVRLGEASLSSEVIWLAVPDDAIAFCAQSLVERRTWRNRIVLHSSGALSSEELKPLRLRGASVASIHPMMTFVRVTRPTPEALRDVSFAIEGDARATRIAATIARKLGGKVLKLSPDHKAAYHAFGAFLSPLVVSELTAAEQVAKAAGIGRAQMKQIMRPILERTLANYLENGGQKAFSGPLVRGDVETIRRHVQSLPKDALGVYLALARFAVGSLKVKNREQLETVLRSAKQS